MKVTKAKIFLVCCLAFIVGTAARSFWGMPLFVSYVLLLALIVILALGWSNKWLKLFAFGGVFLFLGILRFNLSLPAENDPTKIYYYNNKGLATFQGVIAKEPDARADHIKLTVQANAVKGIENDARGRVLVKASKEPNYQYGDELTVTCALRTPGVIESDIPDQEDFDYGEFLAKDNIYSACYKPEIFLLGHEKGNFIMTKILDLKQHLAGATSQILPYPHNTFLTALVLGERYGLPDSLVEKFRQTGVNHIIAVSGMHLTILAGLLAWFLGLCGLSKKRIFYLVIPLLIMFILITGAPPGAVRAGIMAFLVMLAMQTGRVKKMSNALAAAAAGMLLFNPKLLVFDIAFQLSFLATVGIIYLYPVFDKLWPGGGGETYGVFKYLPSPKNIRGWLLITTSAIIFTFPLIIYKFGLFSLIAPLANLLVVPVVSIVMGIGLISMIAGSLWLALGKLIGWLVWFLLSYIMLTVKILSSLPYVSFQFGQIPWWPAVLIYTIIAWLLWKKDLQKFFSVVE